MPKRMRILFVIGSMREGGAEGQLLALMRDCARAAMSLR
jgi:hypothetical protein